MPLSVVMDDSTAQDKCNGVLVEIANDEALKALDERESGYSRVSVPLEQVQPWEGATMPDGDYTVFLYRANVCHLCLLACSCASIAFIATIPALSQPPVITAHPHNKPLAALLIACTHSPCCHTMVALLIEAAPNPTASH